jgi:hypothetical protein
MSQLTPEERAAYERDAQTISKFLAYKIDAHDLGLAANSRWPIALAKLKELDTEAGKVKQQLDSAIRQLATARGTLMNDERRLNAKLAENYESEAT